MMRKISRHDWGGDRASLKMMYTALIRSRLDYASFLYSNAAQCHLIKLDRIQYQAIRIITGNCKFTKIENLEAEFDVLPLSYRRKMLALHYFGKTCRMPNHPVKLIYDEFYRYQYYDNRPHVLPHRR